jgi:hypothetical protein
MRAILSVALAAALAVAASSGTGPRGGSGAERKCPVPIPYTKAQLDEVQKAIHDLPKDSILHQIMRDYENERDDLRFCK